VTLASILALGFLLGMRHALDADHLAAVATLATRTPSLGRTVMQGAVWGAGHTLTLMLFGGAVLVLGGVVPERAAAALELAVGVMLIALGADALYRLRRERIHFHRHRHSDGAEHFHAHSHQGESAPHAQAPHDHRHARGFPARALVVGMIHGLAGSAALVLLSLETLRSPGWGLVYIAIFGVGSILGMAALSAAIAVPLRLTSHRLTHAYDRLSAAIGVATILLGCYIVYRIGIGDVLAG
jgi:ABC-type nickel/cobalt efflux system permease component RcnA